MDGQKRLGKGYTNTQCSERGLKKGGNGLQNESSKSGGRTKKDKIQELEKGRIKGKAPSSTFKYEETLRWQRLYGWYMLL